MNRLVLSSFLLLGGLVFACGPRARSVEPERRKVVEGAPVVAVLDVRVRDGIEFVLHVTNNAPRKLELLFPSGQTHDFAVVDSLGQEVWRWSEGRMFTQAVTNRLVAPASSLSWKAALRAELPPGRYVAIASLLSENKPLEERVEFEVK